MCLLCSKEGVQLQLIKTLSNHWISTAYELGLEQLILKQHTFMKWSLVSFSNYAVHVVSQLLLFCMIIMQMVYIGFVYKQKTIMHVCA